MKIISFVDISVQQAVQAEPGGQWNVGFQFLRPKRNGPGKKLFAIFGVNVLKCNGLSKLLLRTTVQTLHH